MARRDALTRPARCESLRLSQPLACFVQYVAGLAEGKPDQVLPELFPREERGPRDSGDADLRHQPVREDGVVLESERADIAEHVVRAVGCVRGEPRRGKGAHEEVAARAVLDRQLLVIGTAECERGGDGLLERRRDRKSTRLNSSHRTISYAVF